MGVEVGMEGGQVEMRVGRNGGREMLFGAVPVSRALSLVC